MGKGKHKKQMSAVRERVKAYIQEQGLLREGDLVIAGLSGGADSVFLLSVLAEFSGELGFALHAAHIQHGIRGREADRDLRFSREFSHSLGVAFSACYVDSPGYASSHGLGLEEAARFLRYQAFSSLRARLSSGLPAPASCRIAVAHHIEDQAETFLHHLCRGSGIRGLSGMRPMRGELIRPLLTIRKGEILRDLEERGLPYVLDSTNADLSYTRNRIRSGMLPLAEEVNAQAVRHISRTCDLLRETEEVLQEFAAGILARHAEQLPCAIRIEVRPLQALRPLLRRYVFLAMLDALSMEKGRKDWGAVHLEAIDKLLFGKPSAHLDLPCRVCADKKDGMLVLSLQDTVLSVKRKGKSRPEGGAGR